MKKWLRSISPTQMSETVWFALMGLATVGSITWLYLLLFVNPTVALIVYLTAVLFNFGLLYIDSHRPAEITITFGSGPDPVAYLFCFAMCIVAPIGLVVIGTSAAYAIHYRFFGMRLDERMTVTKKVQSNPTIALSCKSGYPENSRCQSDKILSELSIGRSVGGPDIVAECHECRCGWFIAFDHEDLMYKHRDD